MGGIAFSDVLPIILGLIMIVLSVVWFGGVVLILRTAPAMPIKRIKVTLGVRPSLEIECYEVPDPPERPGITAPGNTGE